jgi:hypothetical protein
VTRQELRVELNAWMCGCGSPETVAGFVRDVLTAYRERWASTDKLDMFKLEDRPAMKAAWDAHDATIAVLLPSDGVRYFVLYLLNHWELLEHGGSVGGSWLTDKGKAMLVALDAEACDEFAGLCGESCIHGYDDTDLEHDCAAHS